MKILISNFGILLNELQILEGIPLSIWLFRAGSHGKYESKFIQDNHVYLTWDELNVDLNKFQKKEELYSFLVEKYDLEKEKTAINWVSQIYPIAHRMAIGDWIVLPSKLNRTIHFGRITGEYKYNSQLESPYFHYRDVEWFSLDVPRDRFEQDILYSMGAFLTVCKIHKNNAEERIKEMYKNN